MPKHDPIDSGLERIHRVTLRLISHSLAAATFPAGGKETDDAIVGMFQQIWTACDFAGSSPLTREEEATLLLETWKWCIRKVEGR